MGPFTLTNVILIDADGLRPGAICVADGRITAVGSDVAPQGVVTDLGGALVTPGFIDVHTHGGGGFALHTTDPDEIRSYAEWAPTTGVTAFLAGVVGVPGGPPLQQIAAVRAAAEAPGTGATVLGIHLEGPYISPRRRGAHPESWLRTPDPLETEQILTLAGPWLRLVTLAPELPGAEVLTRRLVAAGVTVSVGHTDATYEQVCAALPWGFTHATHCCNAMRPLGHREPGPLGAILEAPQVQGELIADGVHVHPAMLRLLVGALGADRAVIVSDALRGAGMATGRFEFGGQLVAIVAGAARLPDGTLSGSILTLDQALRNLVQVWGIPLPNAVAMLTRNPARAAGAADRKGYLRPGFDADLLILDHRLHLQATYCRGERVMGDGKPGMYDA
jgi:N-acetylglucosamine-6-phosphate deacetylase